MSLTFWKLLLVYAGLSIGLTCGFLWSSSTWQRKAVLDQAAETLEQVAQGLIQAAAANPSTVESSSNLATELTTEIQTSQRDSRWTLMLLDEGGRYLAGADQPTTDVAAAAEVQTALRGQVAHTARQEAGKSVLHVAVPVYHGADLVGVIRVSRDLTEIDTSLAAEQRWLALWAGIGSLLAIAISYGILTRIMGPLAELTAGARAIVGDQIDPLASGSADEPAALGRALHDMQRKLADRVVQIKDDTERLATVLGNMAEGVVAVSAEESILLANEASRDLLEMTVADPIGRPLLEVTRSLVVHAAFVEALKSSSPVQQEFAAPGAARRVLSLRATRLPGTPSPGVMFVLHDVSELRRLENLRREFVANVSHELKTPLASIKAYAETLKMGAINDPEHSMVFVTRIEEQAERLHQLILDLIRLARVESGQESFEIVDVELAAAVHDCLDQYSAAAAQKQIAVKLVPPPSSVAVRADEEGIRTILSNLIDNAVKYTPAGGNITIRWLDDGSGVTLEVRDSGIGIAEKDQARIFERFYRVDRARSRDMGGTGLGLAIVKHLAQAFGGSVRLESQPKQGSTFRIQLPRGRMPASLHARAASS